MRCVPTRWLAPWGAALALILAPALALAQSGQPSEGPPVTAPKTNQSNPRAVTATPAPLTEREVLPGVPATQRDPAPFGTRSVQVDGRPGVVPGSRSEVEQPGVPGAPAPGTAAVPGAAPAAVPGVVTIEGVVTQLKKPGTDLPGELIRFTVDPTQTWDLYAGRAVPGKPQTTTGEGDVSKDRARIEREKARLDKDQARLDKDQAKGADAETIADDKERIAEDQARLAEAKEARAEGNDETKGTNPRAIDLVLTRNAADSIFTFARTKDGRNLFGASTLSSPDLVNSRTGVTKRTITPPAVFAPSTMPLRTNFTNIKEGSFVAVQYTKVKGVNNVIALSLIEFPLNEPAPAPPASPAAPAPVPGAAPTPQPGAPAPGTPGTVAPRTSRAGEAVPGVPYRVPRVPTQSGGGPQNLPR
ncbi:MAG: hypothetical protein IRY99_13450 [Isosphaeraceae bacterium]|nr:hypothetical protein [Isosphaeraceae bacterium]